MENLRIEFRGGPFGNGVLTIPGPNPLIPDSVTVGGIDNQMTYKSGKIQGLMRRFGPTTYELRGNDDGGPLWYGVAKHLRRQISRAKDTPSDEFQ